MYIFNKIFLNEVNRIVMKNIKKCTWNLVLCQYFSSETALRFFNLSEYLPYLCKPLSARTVIVMNLNYEHAYKALGFFIITSNVYFCRMTDSVDSRCGTSDEGKDCDPSEEARGKEFKNKGVCQSCNQHFLLKCSEFHTVYGRNTSNTAEGRTIQTGDDLQNSMSEKPTSNDTYGDHPHYLQDQLCRDHGTLIGSACCCTSQSMCDTKRVSFVPDTKIPNPMTVTAGHVGTTMQHDRSRPVEQQALLGQIKQHN